jgi:hypothetical protein
MCSIILNYFTIQRYAMEITVTCHPWSLKITILGTKQVPRKMSAYQSDMGTDLDSFRNASVKPKKSNKA